MSVFINILLINSGSRVLLPGITMAIPLPSSTSLKNLGIEVGHTVGVLSAYSDIRGCVAEVLDLTILPNGMPGVVVRGTERMRVLNIRERDDLRLGAIEKLPMIDGELEACPNRLAAFVQAVASASLVRRCAPRLSSSGKLSAIDLYSIANKLCSGFERMNVLKADSLDHMFDILKHSIPGASLFTLDVGAREFAARDLVTSGARPTSLA